MVSDPVAARAWWDCGRRDPRDWFRALYRCGIAVGRGEVTAHWIAFGIGGSASGAAAAYAEALETFAPLDAERAHIGARAGLACWTAMQRAREGGGSPWDALAELLDDARQAHVGREPGMETRRVGRR